MAENSNRAEGPRVNRRARALRICRYCNAAVVVLIAVFIFLLPALTVWRELSDPGIWSAAIPRSAWDLHAVLTPKYEKWAVMRVESKRALELSTDNISGTEWPLFGSVFYLWATESLQEEWEKNPGAAKVAPKIYARGAIEAATKLMIDPRQANWVKIHWGDKYLTTENVFYRMMVIAALTSHARLTGDKQYLPMLKEQVETFSAELDASAFGLLDDYPGECYPGDVLTAIAMIHRADQVLGTDHAAFVNRAIRGFSGKALDRRLVPYSASARAGIATSPTRGCGNSYVSLFAPEIWPEQAKAWYALYSGNFWQSAWTFSGFREFPADLPDRDWYVDVDSGPVLKGFGFAACAFGAGAARRNGHFEHAVPLTAEMLVSSVPLWNGTYLLPRLLSNAADAPYLGEAAILFNLTRLPIEGAAIQSGGSIPGFVRIVLALQIGMGLLLLLAAIRSIRLWRKFTDVALVPQATLQLVIWAGLMVAAMALWACGVTYFAIIPLLGAQMLPRMRARKRDSQTKSMTETPGHVDDGKSEAAA
jgi:hypothetical protein